MLVDLLGAEADEAGALPGENAALERLVPDRFEERRHTALSWVRAFLTCQDGVPVELDLEFASVFPPRERRHVVTSMKGMFFFNLLSNAWSVWAGKALRLSPKETGQVCALKQRPD